MKHTLILATAFILAACQTVPPTSSSAASTLPQTASASVAAPSVKRVWRLSQLTGFAPNQLQNTLMDWTALPSAYADMGCNNMRFQAVIDGRGSLNVSGITTTRMMCPDSMKLENTFATALPKMTRYRVESMDTLVLFNQSGDEMRFTSK
ncbi:META domain-containing protein [Simonsiella muelleri]|uniref:META domain-containing protein n=1 Tax=Simonsiella muelleri TaxID=72 RepID=UPI0023EF6E84|nr:META domain-containing protein [Simonsiella muelleri]